LIAVGQAPIHSTAFSPDGRYLAAVGDDLQLNLWRHDDRGRYQRLQRFPAHKARIWDVAFSPDGSYLATASTDSTVKLWTWADRDRGQLKPQPAQVLQGTGSGIWGLAIAPDGQRIAAASRNQNLRIWNRQGQLLREVTISGNTGLTRIAWSPDGQTLAIAKNNGAIELRSAEGNLLTTLSGHNSIATSVTFSPDGQQLASGSEDRTANLWQLSSLKSLDLVDYGCRWVADRLQQETEPEAQITLCRPYLDRRSPP
jgi:WD40 repeat protein